MKKWNWRLSIRDTGLSLVSLRHADAPSLVHSKSITGSKQARQARIEFYMKSPRSTGQLGAVYAFEDDSREFCEFHRECLFPVTIPVLSGCRWEARGEVIEGAPHGRLMIQSSYRRPITINRCETCTRITEAFFETTRAQMEEMIR